MANKPYYPVGRYACRVTDQALGEAGTGNPQFVLRFKVMGQVDRDDPTRFIPAQQQYERSYYRTITEKSVDYFIEDLKTLGFAGTSFSALHPSSPNFHSFRDLDIDMWCSHEDAQDGGQKEKWSVAQTGASKPLEVKQLEPRKLRDLDNLFGKHLKGLAAKSGPQPAAAMATSGIDQDDIGI